MISSEKVVNKDDSVQLGEISDAFKKEISVLKSELNKEKLLNQVKSKYTEL